MDPFLLAAGIAYLLFGDSAKKGQAATSREASPHVETTAEAEKDAAVLLRRANQPPAVAWAATFRALKVPDVVADALARWTGIESSGNPLAVSRLGERGLLQCLESTALAASGPFSRFEWDSLTNPNTPQEEHARLAVKEFDWLWPHAESRIAAAPDSELDKVWYAKMYHQRPRDFLDVQMHGPALSMAIELARLWQGRPVAMHRLRTASVVAWNDPQPWERHNV